MSINDTRVVHLSLTEGYLHEGKFYHDPYYVFEITGVLGDQYIDLFTDKFYIYNGIQYDEIVRDQSTIYINTSTNKSYISNDSFVNEIGKVNNLSKEDDWNYCSNGNPKITGRYIVTIIPEYETEPDVAVFRYEVDDDEWMESCDGFGGYFSTLCKVIAWKPCPEPAEVKE